MNPVVVAQRPSRPSIVATTLDAPVLFNVLFQPIGALPTGVVEKSSKKCTLGSAARALLDADAAVVATGSVAAGLRSGAYDWPLTFSGAKK